MILSTFHVARFRPVGILSGGDSVVRDSVLITPAVCLRAGDVRRRARLRAARAGQQSRAELHGAG